MSGGPRPVSELDPHPQQLPGTGPLLLAFSGGPDSLCLAWLLAGYALERPLELIHIDHGLDRDSARRAEQALDLARALGLPCSLERVEVTVGGSLEAAAREARYQSLARHMQPGSVVLTAHHANDQVETVLLRLLRGSGPRGLGGMEGLRRFESGWLARPLLQWDRRDIERVVLASGLQPVSDPANLSLDHDRNFLRQRLLPELSQRWPGFSSAIRRSASLCSQAADELQQRVRGPLRRAARDRQLQLDPLSDLSPYMLGEVIRAWLIELGVRPPPGRRLTDLIEQLSTSASDRQPQLRWDGQALFAWSHSLWLEQWPLPEPYAVSWDGARPLQLPGSLGRLMLEGRVERKRLGVLTIQSGSPGERIALPDMTGRVRVNERLRQAGVPPWKRALLPRLYRDKHLLAVADLLISSEFAREMDASRLSLHWDRIHLAA